MKRTKKVLVLCEAFYPEDFIINDLTQEWEKEGYDFEVLTRAPSYPFGKVYDGYKNKIYQKTFFNSIKIHRFPVIQGYHKSTILKILNYFSFVFWSFWIILFIGKRFDKVFIYQTGPLTLATAGIFLKKFFKAKVIIWTQDLWPETVYAYGFKKSKFLSFCLNHFVHWIYKNCDVILVSCKGFINRIKIFVPQKEVIFIPNWSLVEYNPVNKKELPGKLNFTFAGNIGKVQNLDNIVRGFSLFVKKHPEVYLNIIGDGSYLDELRKIVSSENIENVYFLGRKPLSEMADYYEASNVLIISLIDSPLYEIMVPSKFQTYLSTCKPIYAVMKGEVRMLVEDNCIGIGANPSEIDDISRGFEAFVGISGIDLKNISVNSKKLLDSVFCREKIINKINQFVWNDRKYSQ